MIAPDVEIDDGKGKWFMILIYPVFLVSRVILKWPGIFTNLFFKVRKMS